MGEDNPYREFFHSELKVRQLGIVLTAMDTAVARSDELAASIQVKGDGQTELAKDMIADFERTVAIFLRLESPV
jgi:hypothetical protein